MFLESSYSGRVHCKIGCKMDYHREIRVDLTGKGEHRDSWLGRVRAWYGHDHAWPVVTAGGVAEAAEELSESAPGQRASEEEAQLPMDR
jgi:hypothetical protein